MAKMKKKKKSADYIVKEMLTALDVFEIDACSITIIGMKKFRTSPLRSFQNACLEKA